jgi:predicted nucleic acid-binding protein
MSHSPVVSNSSPLIALAQIGHLDLLHQIFANILVPPAVVLEVTPPLTLPSWIAQQPLAQPMGARVLAASLGSGEREAICLALESSAQWLILDDRPARRLATVLGLPIIGTIGVLMAAKRHALLGAVRPCLDALIQHGFYVSPTLYEQALQQAGEAP